MKLSSFVGGTCFVVVCVIMPIWCTWIDHSRARIVDRGTTQEVFEQAFMHTPGSYSVAVRDTNGKLKIDYIGGAELFSDVPQLSPTWYKVNWEKQQNGRLNYTAAEIHLHSAKEINGASWNHGRAGSGTTIQLEDQ